MKKNPPNRNTRYLLEGKPNLVPIVVQQEPIKIYGPKIKKLVIDPSDVDENINKFEHPKIKNKPLEHKADLRDVTLICVDCFNYGKAVAAINNSMQQCNFAAVKFLTDSPIILENVEVIQIKSIKSKDEYSRFLIKDLTKYFDTKYVLVIQHDGYVLNGKSWREEFLDYDYIGAPWLYTDGKNVGNGGFSLRSKKLQNILAFDDFISIHHPEDEIIGRLYRDYLIENYSIKFPSDDLGDRFAYELRTPIYDTFGFHGNFHKPYRKTVIVRRTAAMGDVIMVEPVLHYFYKKGYNVVLETLEQFYMLFSNHYFPVLHPKNVDGRMLSAERYNLDMSYEAMPKQNRLKSYYDFCGIVDGEMRNPKLHMGFDLETGTKLFRKACVIHLEGIRQSGRNVFGVDWEAVVEFLKKKGYSVFQVGKRNVPFIKNATYINTINEHFLCYTVGSASLFIGIDSGVSHIASAFNVPSIIFFGNTKPEIVHVDLSNKVIITNHSESNPICARPYCWHDQIGVESHDCYIDAKHPPCAKYSTEQVINAINSI